MSQTLTKVLNVSVILLWIAASALFAPFLVYQWSSSLLPPYIWSILLQAPAIALLCTQVSPKPKFSRPTIRMGVATLLGLLIMAGTYFILAHVPPINISIPWLSSLPRPLYIQTPLLMWLTACLIGPFIEEYLYRGLLVDFMQKQEITLIVQAIISSLLFSVLHLNSHGLIPLFIMGLLLFSLRTQFKSLTAPLILHIAYNATLLALFQI